MAQDKIWVNGSQLVDFNNALTGVNLCGLPTNHDYDGTPAQYSQNAQYDENGKLLFFVIDGNIYDGEGYRMADNDADPECYNCLMKGIQEVGITPMPGTCDKYYIIMADCQNLAPFYEWRSQLTYSILDLSLDSYFHAGRLGRVWTNVEAETTPGYEDVYANGYGFINQQQEYGYSMFLLTHGNVATAPYPYDGNDHKTVNMQFAVHDGPGLYDQKTLFIRTVKQYLWATIGQYGISTVTPMYNVPATSESELDFHGQLATADGPDGLIRVAAISNGNLSPQEPNSRNLHILSMVSIGSTPTFNELNTNIYHSSNLDSQPRGLAFSPNGRYLYFSQHVAPYIGYIDVLDANVTVHDLGSELGQDLSGYGNGQINLNTTPGGTVASLYFPSANGMGFLVNPDDPSNALWNSSGSLPAGLATAPTSYWTQPTSQSGQYFTQYLMDKQNYRDQQIPHLLQQTCCTFTEQIPEGNHDYTFSGTNTPSTAWTPTANGLTSTGLCPPANGIPSYGHVFFSQDFHVLPGARLYVQDMDWRFAPNARLIVERGGFVKFTNCTLEGSQCGPQRWPGVRVEGTTTASQYPTTGGAQGYIYLSNTTLKDAETGIWCARENGGVEDAGYYGGIVRTSGGTFLNCINPDFAVG